MLVRKYAIYLMHKMRHPYVSLQVEVLTKDTERLAAENNQLHLQLIQQADKQENSMREHIKKRKSLDNSIAELTFCKTSLSSKSATLEKEKAALQAKLQKALRDLEACHQAVSDGELLNALKKPVTVSLHDGFELRPSIGVVAHCLCRQNLPIAGEDMPERPVYLDTPDSLLQSITEAEQQPMDGFSADNVDVQQTSQNRIAALEAAAKEREAELHSAKQDVESLQVRST